MNKKNMKRVLLWIMAVLLGLGGLIYILIKVVDHKVQQVFELDELVSGMLERKDYQGVFEITNSNEKFLNIIEYLGMKIFDVIGEKDDVEMKEIMNSFRECKVPIYYCRMQAYNAMGKKNEAIAEAIKCYTLFILDGEYFGVNSVNLYLYEFFPVFKKYLSYTLTKVNEMVDKNEDCKKWELLRAVIYQWGCDYENAIKGYNNLEKEFEGIHYTRSACYEAIGDSKNAIQDLTVCIEEKGMIGAEYPDVLGDRAEIYRNIGLYEKAIDDYTRKIKLMNSSYAHCDRGWCYELAGNNQKAMEDYNVAINKNIPRSFLLRGKLYKKQGQMKLANDDFNEVLRLDTIADEGSFRHYALLSLGKEEEAIAWMDKIMEANTNQIRLYYDKVRLLLQMDRVDDAVAILRTCLERGDLRLFWRIEHDRDMEAIRNHPAFTSLVEKYEAEKKALWAE